MPAGITIIVVVVILPGIGVCIRAVVVAVVIVVAAIIRRLVIVIVIIICVVWIVLSRNANCSYQCQE